MQIAMSMSASTVKLLREKALPKGDPLEVVRIAGLQAAKKTSELILLCHPLALTHLDVSVEVLDDGARIVTTARTTAGTGVEMEALTAASVAALTLYDMCKAVEKGSSLAMVRLARLYENGDAVPRDPARVAFWYGKAAEKGDRFSMISLGKMYEVGAGVERNLDRARQLYVQAVGNQDDNFADQARNLLANLNRAAIPAAPRNVSPPSQPNIVPQDNTPDPPRQPCPVGHGLEPADPHLPPGRMEQAREHFQRRGLAGAVRANVADHLAAFHGEIDPIDGGDDPCAAAQPPHLQTDGEVPAKPVSLDDGHEPVLR
jgi:cyclic pyranopterin phosphate synthase